MSLADIQISNNSMEMEIEDNQFITPIQNPFPLVPLNKTYFKSLSKAEMRIKKDLFEYEDKPITTGKFEIRVSKYEVLEVGDVILFVEFKNIFVLKFIFPNDYPFSAPEIIYVEGNRFDMFDMEDNIKLICLKKEKWSPVLTLNSLLFQIELLITERNDSLFGRARNIRKKKFSEYIEENKEIYPQEMTISFRLKILKV